MQCSAVQRMAIGKAVQCSIYRLYDAEFLLLSQPMSCVTEKLLVGRERGNVTKELGRSLSENICHKNVVSVYDICAFLFGFII